MLRELRIKNFAVIDEVALELGPGLNVLTGETGAGKSIVLNALGLFADPHFALPVAPAFVLFGACATLGPRKRA